MKKFLIIISLLAVTWTTHATHIVGGEFQFVEQRSGLYDIFLNLYFDEINGNPDAKDQSFTATIFRKSDNAVMATVEFTLINESLVEYENPECNNGLVVTSRLTYAAQNLSTGEVGFQFTTNYDDPDGYYIVWDRCCRNGTIVNIVDPQDAGMVFYLHFPPIFDNNGDLTGWSSPAFNPIPATYACVGEPFNLDFGATDIDSDSLVFSLQTPLNGYSSPDTPVYINAKPEPYPLVNWQFGINNSNQIPGTPSLSVNSSTGNLYVIPSQPGLHVFSVMVEEYRDGVKIGEVRRDFQVFVYDDCQVNEPPSLQISLGDSAFYVDSDTLTIYSSDYSCMDLRITDNQDVWNSEKIKVKVIPRNFITDVDMVNEGTDQFVDGLGDTLTGWQICPPTCEDIVDDPFVFDVIVYDDGCPQPKSDTMRVIIDLIAEPNTPPVLTSDFSDDSIIDIEVFEIDTIDISFTGYDADSTNLISISVIPDEFSLDDFGMEFENTSLIGPTINADFRWVITCEKLEGSNKDRFKMWFVLADNSCGEQRKDTIELNVRFNYEVVSEEFEIFNVFTPNGDGINENFTVKGLPRDNCENQYVSFEIYNRWGRQIFESEERQFQWDGDEISDGVYYYVARYTNKSYKGHFTVLR